MPSDWKRREGQILADLHGNCRSPKLTRLSNLVRRCHLTACEGRCGIQPTMATDLDRIVGPMIQ